MLPPQNGRGTNGTRASAAGQDRNAAYRGSSLAAIDRLVPASTFK